MNALAKAQIEPAEITYLRHGSTIASRGAKAGYDGTRNAGWLAGRAREPARPLQL
ncbi:MAG: hypothetical protein OXG37_07215 [Actinomycetia bacterium]|nr:hypothetical protein [Actinomycetes bacterium]